MPTLWSVQFKGCNFVAVLVPERLALPSSLSRRSRRDPEPKLQPLSKVHFELVLAHMVPPSRAAQAAQQRRRARRNGGQGGGGGLSLISQTDVQALAHAIASGLAHVGALRGSAASGHPIESSEEEEA